MREAQVVSANGPVVLPKYARPMVRVLPTMLGPNHGHHQPPYQTPKPKGGKDIRPGRGFLLENREPNVNYQAAVIRQRKSVLQLLAVKRKWKG